MDAMTAAGFPVRGEGWLAPLLGLNCQGKYLNTHSHGLIHQKPPKKFAKLLFMSLKFSWNSNCTDI